MPCLELSCPALAIDVKRKLSTELTNNFSAITGHPTEIFGIHFHEYGDNEVTVGGVLWTADSGLVPYLHGLLYVPRLKRSVKRKVVETLTQVFVKCLGKPDWKPVFHLCEHPFDNVGVQGKLLSDSYEECAKATFYYDLPQD